jgi:hypothetical protein
VVSLCSNRFSGQTLVFSEQAWSQNRKEQPVA